jgi:putative FmdB family regulatory protein
MPIYEYTCQKCNSRFDLLVRGSEVPVCPECSSTRLAKELSVPAAHVASGESLPVCRDPVPAGGCGRPQCGTGFCAGP